MKAKQILGMVLTVALWGGGLTAVGDEKPPKPGPDHQWQEPHASPEGHYIPGRWINPKAGLPPPITPGPAAQWAPPPPPPAPYPYVQAPVPPPPPNYVPVPVPVPAPYPYPAYPPYGGWGIAGPSVGIHFDYGYAPPGPFYDPHPYPWRAPYKRDYYRYQDPHYYKDPHWKEPFPPPHKPPLPPQHHDKYGKQPLPPHSYGKSPGGPPPGKPGPGPGGKDGQDGGNRHERTR